jgi:hypothetical protein
VGPIGPLGQQFTFALQQFWPFCHLKKQHISKKSSFVTTTYYEKGEKKVTKNPLKFKGVK